MILSFLLGLFYLVFSLFLGKTIAAIFKLQFDADDANASD